MVKCPKCGERFFSFDTEVTEDNILISFVCEGCSTYFDGKIEFSESQMLLEEIK